MIRMANHRRGSRTSTVLRVVSLVAVVALVLSVSGPIVDTTRAQVQSDEEAPCVEGPPDAQSTTGPKPPPGVDVAGASFLSAAPVIISDVPAYEWRHGCGPTAAGMVVGYWDGEGCGWLVPGDASSQTPSVDEMIASEGPASNYSDYCLPIDIYPDLFPDNSEPPAGDEHWDECVADYMKTSQSWHQNRYGWSWFSHVGPAMENYVYGLGQGGYLAVADNLYWWDSSLNWDSFRAEIDARRPLVLLVDTDADGSTDHFVPAIGYDVVGGVERYACYNTWDTDIHWFEFAPMADGQPWGIYGAVTLHIKPPDYETFLPLVLRGF